MFRFSPTVALARFSRVWRSRNRSRFSWTVLVGGLGWLAGVTHSQETPPTASELIDRYFDQRYEQQPMATSELLDELKSQHGISTAQRLEVELRKPRFRYPDVSKLTGKATQHAVQCDHVSYKSTFLLFIPPDYEPSRASPLVIVGHGGNSSMSDARATSVASMYLRAYAPTFSRDLKAVVVAPVSTRGWGHIGNSLILSTISQVRRMLCIDPDRIYITGQSMGGHLSYRSALTLPDRWGAVSPQSGGYDFVEKGSIGNLLNVPGYVTWGKREPYGIDRDNRTNASWAEQHGLDWVFVEKNGGHAIYQDELPKVSQFFAQHPRNLYRDSVYFRQGGAMKFIKTWNVKGWPEHEIYHETRPLRWNVKHWVEVTPRPDLEKPITLLAANLGDNRIQLTTDQARQVRLYLHPKMIDFNKKLTVEVNGETVFDDVVQPDLRLMLELAREFDDRGRLFWAALDLKIDSDQEVTIPRPETRPEPNRVVND